MSQRANRWAIALAVTVLTSPFCLTARSAIARDAPSDPPPHTEAAVDRLLRGLNELQQGNWTAAIAEFDRALALDPDYAEAYLQRGYARRQLGDSEAAFQDFSEAIARNPTDPNAYFYRGLIDHENRRDSLSALLDLSEAIALDPDFGDAYLVRGDAQAALGNWNGAIADYNRALRRGGSPFLVYLGLGNARLHLEDWQGALAAYDRAIALRETAPPSATTARDAALAYYNRGVVWAELGNAEAALRDFSQAIDRDPDYADAYFNRGAIYHNDFQQRDRAIADFERAAQLYQRQGDRDRYERTLEQLGAISQWDSI